MYCYDIVITNGTAHDYELSRKYKTYAELKTLTKKSTLAYVKKPTYLDSLLTLYTQQKLGS
jgi:hypothetical protein